MRSGQKGALEQAHTMLRMILPKGTSFEFFDAMGCESHCKSYQFHSTRESWWENAI